MKNNINKTILSFALALMLVANLAACGAKAQEVEIDEANKIVLNYPENLAPYGFVEPVILNGVPTRVVSMSNLPVMVLYALGIEMVAVPKTMVVEWPKDLDEKTAKLEIAMNSNFDIETVVALNPDLVIVGKTHVDTYGKILSDAKIPVYYVDDGHVVSYASAKALATELIKTFGADDPDGQEIMDRFETLEARFAEQRQKNKGTSVMILQSAPPIHYIQASGGTLGSMLDMLGFENVYTNERAPLVPLDMEQAISYDPDLFFSIGILDTSEGVQKIIEADFAKNPAYWAQIKAIGDGRAIYLPVGFISSGGIDIIDKMNTLIDTVEAINVNK